MHVRSLTRRALMLLLAASMPFNGGMTLPCASACGDEFGADPNCRCCASFTSSKKALASCCGSTDTNTRSCCHNAVTKPRSCCQKDAVNPRSCCHKSSDRKPCCQKAQRVDEACHCRLDKQPSTQPIPTKPGNATRRQFEQLLVAHKSVSFPTFLLGAEAAASDLWSKLPSISFSSIQTLLCVWLT